MTSSGLAGLQGLLDGLPAGAEPVIIGDNPSWQQSPNSCVSKHLKDPDTCAVNRADSHSPALQTMEKEAVTAHGGSFVDTVDLLCDESVCPAGALQRPDVPRRQPRNHHRRPRPSLPKSRRRCARSTHRPAEQRTRQPGHSAPPPGAPIPRVTLGILSNTSICGAMLCPPCGGYRRLAGPYAHRASVKLEAVRRGKPTSSRRTKCVEPGPLFRFYEVAPGFHRKSRPLRQFSSF